MKRYLLTAAITQFYFATAATAASGAATIAADGTTPSKPAISATDSDTVTTGVAKGRDRLDSATSTSSLREADIAKLAPRSIGELMRDIPGVRSEASTGEGNANISIRGLPIASSGAKFVQLEEDGLPVLEFGDIGFNGADMFLRADLNLARVDVIRGGSASTFASNSPGGIINFISKTGDTQGGAVALTSGLDYDLYRADFDYGTRLSDTLRMHIGGFYHEGEGPRTAGYDAVRGGQLKVNVTKEFTGGYIRFYGKYLDDRSPYYDAVPFLIGGTNSNPTYTEIPNFDPKHDSLGSRYIQSISLLDRDNNLTSEDVRQGQHATTKSFGVEAQVTLGDWTLIEKFRYANNSGHLIAAVNPAVLPASVAAVAFGGPGATLAFANGPQAGMAITSPSTLNGNGLVAVSSIQDVPISNLDNVTNDIRATRTWQLGQGELTTTGGVYVSQQTIDHDLLWAVQVFGVLGNGQAQLINIFNGGHPVTQNGTQAYDLSFYNGAFRRRYMLDYGVKAPFASLNYHIGKIALGGSVRYDFGTARGSIAGSDLGGGRIGVVTRDINGDGIITPAEQQVGVTPLTSSAPVHYDYRYLSYSVGVNYRIAEPVSVFGRYSLGARANADRILFSPAVSPADGSLLVQNAAYDPVRQAEIGAKFRKAGLTLNLTGFYAKAQDTNIDTTTGVLIARQYRAIGAEFEGGYHQGIFGLTASATYTHAKIIADQINPAVVGNTPRHQANVIFQATPQITTRRFSIGAVFIGTTDSYALDTNQIKMPGYVTTNAFVQFRLTDRVSLSVNADNVFDTLAITAVNDPKTAVAGILDASVLTGRTVSATARFDF